MARVTTPDAPVVLLVLNVVPEGYGADEALRAVAYILENVRALPGRQSHVVFKLAGPLFGYHARACGASPCRSGSSTSTSSSWTTGPRSCREPYHHRVPGQTRQESARSAFPVVGDLHDMP